ncbi:MAG TPA: nicotinate-nucleotide adenylyltransferase [Alphaproteobacteria bacterium]|nr:nicotinate-nucleotide adenylyltransferase [Alphaproteobacteria bacterium]
MTAEDIPGTAGLPPHAPGMRIGLFGGSFNPVHEGHRLVALQCLERLALDAVWLLVSPGNPLKDRSELAPLADRLGAARALIRHPRVRVTGFEMAHGFFYTVQTISWLVRTCPGVRFVWIMGSDSLSQFARWERWQEIAALVPMAVYARPGSRFSAMSSPAATALGRYRLREGDAPALAGRRPPAWVYLHGLSSDQSSTAIRRARNAMTGRAAG